MDAVINAVIPVFAVVLTGYVAGRMGVLGPASGEALNQFVYYGALPALLFISMARVSPEQLVGGPAIGPFLGAYGGGAVAVAILAWLISRFVHGHDRSNQTMYGFCALFSNTGYMGIPLALVAFGPEAVVPAAIASVINAAVVVGTVSAILEVGAGSGGASRGVVRDILRGLLRNPLVVAPILGILYSLFGPSMPRPVETYFTILGAAAGPGALFALGLFLVGKGIGGGRGELAGMVGLKLLAQPLVTWGLAVTWFPMDNMWTSMAVVLAALPTGATVFVIALRNGVYVQRSSAAILVSTCLSVVTLAVFLTLIKG